MSPHKDHQKNHAVVKQGLATNLQKGVAIKPNGMYECEICFYAGPAKDFTPVTPGANLSVLECPKCLNNDKGSFEEEIDVVARRLNIQRGVVD